MLPNLYRPTNELERKLIDDCFNLFKYFNLSIYADTNGYSLVLVGRYTIDNCVNYSIVYSNFEESSHYYQSLENELKQLKLFLKRQTVYVKIVKNNILSQIVEKNLNKTVENIDFKLDELPSYHLSIELLIQANQLTIHPYCNSVSNFSNHYKGFNIALKNYSIYALMVGFIDEQIYSYPVNVSVARYSF